MVTIVQEVSKRTGISEVKLLREWDKISDSVVDTFKGEQSQRTYAIAAMRFLKHVAEKFTKKSGGVPKKLPPLSPRYAILAPDATTAPDHLDKFGTQWARQSGALDYAKFSRTDKTDKRGGLFNAYEK